VTSSPTSSSTTSSSTSALEAPGRLGEAIDARQLLVYLTALGQWVDRQRAELDRVNRAALSSSQSDSYTADIVLAETLWQATKVRREQLETVWDSGRADAVAREKMSQLIWGRLDSGGGAELVSMVEAIRLCDALVSQLGTRLSLDPQSTGVTSRIVGLRAEIERSRDLTDGQGPELDRVNTLRARVDQLAEKAGRGADVTGPLAQLVQDSAKTERDLIVASSQKRDLARDRQRAQAAVASAEKREPVLRMLAARCRREIADPPRLAIPDVARLGPVPQSRADLDAYLKRLDAVSRAFDAVEEAYAGQLRERAELRYRLEGYHAKAESNGRSASPTVASGYQEAKEHLDAVPCELVLARFFVEQYQFLTRELPQTSGARSAAPRSSAPRSSAPGQEGRAS
jgi:hypothetical protein